MEHCMGVSATTNITSLSDAIITSKNKFCPTLTMVSLIKFSKTSWRDLYALVLIHSKWLNFNALVHGHAL